MCWYFKTIIITKTKIPKWPIYIFIYTLTEGGLSLSPPPLPESVRRLWDGIKNSKNRQTLDKNKTFKFFCGT